MMWLQKDKLDVMKLKLIEDLQKKLPADDFSLNTKY